MDRRSDAEFRAEIVARARLWIGTPYRHQASCRGAGCDCLGLIRGIWREVYGEEPETPPPYTADWGEPTREEVLLAAAERHFGQLTLSEMLLGDVVVLRMIPGGPAKHLAVLAADMGAPTLVHAYSGHGVVESPLIPAWRAKIAGAFRFPARST